MEQRVQDSLKRIDDAAAKMQRDLEKNNIRKLQGRVLRDGAACCENTSCSAEEVQECIRKTQQPLNKVQAVIKQELEDFQQRLHRCMLTCQDKAKDLLTNQNQMQPEVEQKFADCMCACSDEHLKLIPLMKMRLEAAMPKM